jgi:hypothetical protein
MRKSGFTAQRRPAPTKDAPVSKPSDAVRPRPSIHRLPRRNEDDEIEDVEVIEDEDDVVDVEVIEDEEEERPRRRRKRSRTGPYATCPDCGERGDASRISFTLWGGVLGPWLFTHVRCNNCGTAYNGKTGESNTTAIALYVVIGFAIAAVFGFLAYLIQAGK